MRAPVLRTAKSQEFFSDTELKIGKQNTIVIRLDETERKNLKISYTGINNFVYGSKDLAVRFF